MVSYTCSVQEGYAEGSLKVKKGGSHHGLFSGHDFPARVLRELSQLGPDVGVVAPASQ
jgi:hypothetical protein